MALPHIITARHHHQSPLSILNKSALSPVARGGKVIVISLVCAFLLTALPLPSWADTWRPAWVLITLIYWCMALPDRVGIGRAWGIGLLLDVQQGGVLGQQALGFALIAYLIIQIHKRLRVFSLIQQACLVGFMIGFNLLIASWIDGIMGFPPQSWTYWMPAVTGVVVWPCLFVILRNIRRRYKIT